MKNQWVSCPEPICQTGGCPYFWVPNTVFFVDDPFSFSLPTMNKNDKTSSLAWNYFLPVMHYFLIFFVASLAKYQWDTQVVGEHGEKTRKKCPIYIYPPKKIEKRNILKSDGWFFYGFLGLLRVAIHLLPRFWGSSEAAPKTDTQTLLWVLGDGPSGPSTRRRVGNHQADWHWKLIEYFLNINSTYIHIYIYMYCILLLALLGFSMRPMQNLYRKFNNNDNNNNNHNNNDNNNSNNNNNIYIYTCVCMYG